MDAFAAAVPAWTKFQGRSSEGCGLEKGRPIKEEWWEAEVHLDPIPEDGVLAEARVFERLAARSNALQKSQQKKKNEAEKAAGPQGENFFLVLPAQKEDAGVWREAQALSSSSKTLAMGLLCSGVKLGTSVTLSGLRPLGIKPLGRMCSG